MGQRIIDNCVKLTRSSLSLLLIYYYDQIDIDLKCIMLWLDTIEQHFDSIDLQLYLFYSNGSCCSHLLI